MAKDETGTTPDPEATDRDDGFEVELTDDERAALKITGDDDEPFASTSEEQAAKNATADSGDTPAQDGASDNSEGGAASGADEPAAAEDVAPKVAPLKTVQLPEDVKAEVDKIAADIAALDEKFDEGEIDNKEYRAQRDALNDKRTDLRLAVERNAIAADMREQEQTQKWVDEYTRWGKVNPDINLSNKQVTAAFNAILGDVETEAQKAGKSLSNADVLAAAGKRYRETFGLPTPAAKPATPARKSVVDAGLPPTLRNVPAAESNDQANSVTAVLNRMAESDPIAFNDRLAELQERDPDAYDRYLRGA